MSNNNVLVFIEQSRGKIAPVSMELISEAHKLADVLGVKVDGVSIGSQMDKAFSEVGAYGCQRVFYFDDERLAEFRSLPYAKCLVNVIRSSQPQIVLFGASVIGRDVAPRVASELECGLTADCTSLEIGDYESRGKSFKNILLQNRPAFGGNIVATIVSPESFPSMATVREGVMKIERLDNPLEVKVVKEAIEFKNDDFITEIIEIVRQEKAINLKSSNIIVSAGMGAANPVAIKLVADLAKTIGGVVGASRPVVDSGLLSKEHQIGQTGVTVRPNLYIACGISGQIQHRAGMSEAKRIIAINSDPDAPIFGLANYGIVGDIAQVIPKMIKAYQEKN